MKLNKDQKNIQGIIRRLRKFNEWRRSEDAASFGKLRISPEQIGKDIDFAANLMQTLLDEDLKFVQYNVPETTKYVDIARVGVLTSYDMYGN